MGDTERRRDEEALTVAAAASAEPVSPELALVDATLARELRAVLVVAEPVAEPLVDTSTPAGFDREEPADEPIEVPLVTPVSEIDEHDPLADLILQGPESPVVVRPTFDAELVPSSDPIVEETDQQTETSWYPELPAPQGDGPEPMDATEATLREIRDRLTTPAPARRRRRFRRRFTIASGLSTAVALGVFAASVGFGVTQLPV
jgi:hypothetical protein